MPLTEEEIKRVAVSSLMDPTRYASVAEVLSCENRCKLLRYIEGNRDLLTRLDSVKLGNYESYIETVSKPCACVTLEEEEERRRRRVR